MKNVPAISSGSSEQSRATRRMRDGVMTDMWRCAETGPARDPILCADEGAHLRIAADADADFENVQRSAEAPEVPLQERAGKPEAQKADRIACLRARSAIQGPQDVALRTQEHTRLALAQPPYEPTCHKRKWPDKSGHCDT